MASDTMPWCPAIVAAPELDGNAAKSAWKPPWLSTTARARRNTVTRPARAMHTVTARTDATASATTLGAVPAAAPCENAAANVETAAAVKPRTTRVRRSRMKILPSYSTVLRSRRRPGSVADWH
ncbi:hypothetical protein D9V29_13315 [Mycetocola manganoxydans]|uniref:Uncharacterized protein n=1 Tax=Mycetocola manganoxydans TaxID=699879 RepID=A0A3L6ZM12_9MICO|nr:hypothetical protein D9V29_13315 [Mycetocola manganoxydans]